MITIYDAGLADEFHIAHAGLPCTIWTRDGETHYGVGEGQFRVPIVTYNAQQFPGERCYHAITTVNAGDFHTAVSCPHARSDQSDIPPVTRPYQPALSTAGRDAAGYDEHGYDEAGYDRRGCDAEGFDRRGYDDLGYDRAGFDSEGYDRAGFDAYGFNREGYDDDGYDSDGYDSDGYNSGGLKAGGYNRAGDLYCEDCEEAPCECATCDSCGNHFPDGALTETLDDSSVCDRCRAGYYTWCEDCEGYYPDNDGDEHQHGRGGYGCCDSPQPAFAVRNDGCEPLASDTRFTITLPAGVISDEGLYAISQYLIRRGLLRVGRDLDTLGNQWQTKDGNYTKRLSRHAYQTYGVKLTPEILSQVGCIARDHSNQVSTEIEVTRQLNMSDYEFGNPGSCWWGGYSESRCALKTNGGFGLRSFTDDDDDVAGRAWVLPLRQDEHGNMHPTFDTMTPDAFVVFNGYGDLSDYTAPRIMAHMAGWTYRKIGFECSPMYVNAGGYLIAPEDIAKPYTDGYLQLFVSQHSSLFDTERELVNA